MASDAGKAIKEEHAEHSDCMDVAAMFSIDHRLIPQAHAQNDSIPSDIVQEVYDQDVFEDNVLAQVEEAAEREQRDNLAARKRMVNEIDEAMKYFFNHYADTFFSF